ncbi:hypothetical protein ACPCG0_04680 [Propionibacteriaceae bacterium Y1923]|uniref:hypothetical protein n=1 Tax=Aestuariimicrobium sp. Y1814 TaxID=3418742 RepID=UPI003C149174
MARLSRCRAALVAAVLATSLSFQALPAHAEDTTFAVTSQLELTGLAVDQDLGIYWAVQGAASRNIIAVDSTGTVAGTMTLSEPVTSVQALASRNGVLYVADIGDPQANRETITVLRVGEPGYHQVTPLEWEFTYEDGPHDAGAFGVSGRGNLYVITRGANPGIYRANTQPEVGVTSTLTRLADAPAGVSDMTFLADGSTIALWGEAGLFLLNGFDFRVTAVSPVARTGEALTVGLEQELLMLGTGGNPAQVVATPRPTGMTSITPAPSPTPTPTPSPSASGTPGDEQVPDGSAAARRTGTMAAIGGAAGLAVLAGVATAFWPVRHRRGPRRGV